MCFAHSRAVLGIEHLGVDSSSSGADVNRVRTRSNAGLDPSDQTPPSITLQEPSGAVLLP
jgi:hypothetical protein